MKEYFNMALLFLILICCLFISNVVNQILIETHSIKQTMADWTLYETKE